MLLKISWNEHLGKLGNNSCEGFGTYPHREYWKRTLVEQICSSVDEANNQNQNDQAELSNGYYLLFA